MSLKKTQLNEASVTSLAALLHMKQDLNFFFKQELKKSCLKNEESCNKPAESTAPSWVVGAAHIFEKTGKVDVCVCR